MTVTRWAVFDADHGLIGPWDDEDEANRWFEEYRAKPGVYAILVPIAVASESQQDSPAAA